MQNKFLFNMIWVSMPCSLDSIWRLTWNMCLHKTTGSDTESILSFVTSSGLNSSTISVGLCESCLKFNTILIPYESLYSQCMWFGLFFFFFVFIWGTILSFRPLSNWCPRLAFYQKSKHLPEQHGDALIFSTLIAKQLIILNEKHANHPPMCTA